MNKFFINCLDFELELINSGTIKIKTKIKKIAGIICSNLII